MPIWLAVLLLTVAFAAVSAWISRRLLDAQIGWIRALVTATVVFLGSLPLTVWVFEQADIIDGDRVVVESPIVLAFVALVLGWMFAVVVIVLVTLEFLWPSRPLGNPVTIVRDAFRRRDPAGTRKSSPSPRVTAWGCTADDRMPRATRSRRPWSLPWLRRASRS